MISAPDITGLVLAGGAGRRMGGLDKGLQLLRGLPLAQHALHRLQPQVGPCLVSANRHLEAYAALGVPVLPDAVAGHPGPLAGLLAGLNACRTSWLLSVPCDTPAFPADLAARLATGVAAGGAAIAMAATAVAGGPPQRQPVFCLVQRTLAADLAAFIGAGGASPWAWASRHGVVEVVFDDTDAFFNANTPAELDQLR